MRKKLTAAAAAAAIAASVLPQAINVFAADENTDTVNNSVSGYISVVSGTLLAKAGRALPIYVDDNDYPGVTRAAGDLADDLGSVTGTVGEVTNNVPNQTTADTDTAFISSVDTVSGTMRIENSERLEGTARGIAAVYNEDGSLKCLSFSSGTASVGTDSLSFDPVTAEVGETVRAFLWYEDNGSLSAAPAAPAYSENKEISSVLIGTIGNSEAIDALISDEKLDVSDIEGKWESFTIQQIDDRIVIAGSDKRGTIYGIYDLSEKIGVSPWSWWADAAPAHADELYIDLPDGGYTEGEPSVKYRGIFLNDEYNFSQWSESLGEGNMNTETYKRVFELLLRLKANTLWPAMHKYSNEFHSTPDNAAAADEYGIVMGSSHAEPLLRNNLGELDEFQEKWEAANPEKPLYKPVKNETGTYVAYYWTDFSDEDDKEGTYVYNKEFLEDYWRECVKNYGQYENIYTLGMRGVHDGSFQTNTDHAEALQEIIDCQRKILEEELCGEDSGRKIEDIPQVFIPYKDVLQYYNSGELEIPDDVTIMWTDDNYGYIRQTASTAEQQRAGRTGVYYHISYYGNPTSYLWLSTTQPGLIREELSKAYDTGSDRMWILNVGDLKPAEKEIEYFARLASDVEGTKEADISEIYAQNAKRDFNMSDDDAAEYAEVMDKFYELANSKRPDFFRTEDTTYGLDISLSAYGDEAERYLNEYKDICSRTEELYSKLPDEKQAAFFELALYPIRSAKNMAVNYIQSERAELYTEQQRGSAAERYAAEAQSAVDSISADLDTYNTMLDGKWDKMANINPKELQGCDAHITLDLNAPTLSELDYTKLEIMTDSQTEYSDAPSMTVSACDSYDKFIDVINQGYGSFEYKVTSTSSALKFDKTSGTAYGSDRIRVSVDPSKASAGTEQATVTVSQLLNGNVIDSKDIAVTIENPSIPSGDAVYIETGGVVSIEAEHYSDIVSQNGYEWKLEKDFGRSGDSMKVYPETASNAGESDIAGSAAYLEYDVYFTNSGEYTWDIYRMPTLNEGDDTRSCRFAVAFDSGEPTVMRGTSAYPSSTGETKNKANSWSQGVLMNSEKLSTSITVDEPGIYKIRIYNISPGITIDKMVLHKDDISSYFGAPESYNTTYNTEKLSSATTNEASPETEPAKLYEPKTVIGSIAKSGDTVSTAELHRIDSSLGSAVVIAAAYDESGNVTNAELAETEFTDDTASVDINLTLTDDTAGYALYVVDDLANLQPIAPYKIYGTVKSEADSEYAELKTDLSDHYGKKSVLLIADCEITEELSADDIVYVYGEALDRDSYKYIPFDLPEGVYYTRTGIDGGTVLDLTLNTIVNIYPENDGVKETLNTWSFTEGGLNDDEGKDPFVLSGGASVTNDGKIKMNTADAAGGAAMTYSEPVTAVQGGKLTVEFDIYYGKLDGKTMTYAVTDSTGNTLTSVKLNAYNPETGASVMIGGNETLTDYSELSNAVSRSNKKAADNGPTHFKNVFDFSAGRAYVTVSSEKGTAEFTGKLQSGTSNISSISFTTNYENDERACLVDDVSVWTQTAPQYKIDIQAENAADGSPVDDAQITVKDAATGVEIAPVDGSYMLCEGSYTVTASAEGFRTTEMPLELTPALTVPVVIPMTSSNDLIPATVTIRYRDEEGNQIKDDTVITDNIYVGDHFTVPEEYTYDFVKPNDSGKTDLYTFNESRSQTSAVLDENTVLTLEFNLREQYDYYEDFENYTIDEAAWENGDGDHSLTLECDKTDYLKYSCVSGSSVGSYTNINEIDCEGKTVKIEADLKFVPLNISGASQFSIGNTDPAFSGTKISYGFEGAAGHIIGFMHNGSKKTFTVNGIDIGTDFIGEWMHIEADADFAAEKVTIRLTTESGLSKVIEDADFCSSSVDPYIGSIYMRGGSGGGSVSADNIKIMITGDGVPAEPEIPSVLNYKSVYAFGDSIVFGHNDADNAFMNILSKRYAMKLTKYAANGATVIDSGNDIIAQVEKASEEEPDFIVFDGYTNDAYGDPETDTLNKDNHPDVTKLFGEPQGSSATEFDSSNFCGAFEEIIYTMKQKWPNAKIVFVTIHKSGARNFDIQTELHDLTIKMCGEWGVEVVDIFNDSDLDTRDPDQMYQYMIGHTGSHPNVEACNKFYIPSVAAKLIELCGGETAAE